MHLRVIENCCPFLSFILTFILLQFCIIMIIIVFKDYGYLNCNITKLRYSRSRYNCKNTIVTCVTVTCRHSLNQSLSRGLTMIFFLIKRYAPSINGINGFNENGTYATTTPLYPTIHHRIISITVHHQHYLHHHYIYIFNVVSQLIDTTIISFTFSTFNSNTI